MPGVHRGESGCIRELWEGIGMAVECYSRFLGRAWRWAWLFTIPDDKEEPIGDKSLCKLTKQVTADWDQQSNKMIGIKAELFLDPEGWAGREVSTGRDKERHGNSEGASQCHVLCESATHPSSH